MNQNDLVRKFMLRQAQHERLLSDHQETVSPFVLSLSKERTINVLMHSVGGVF